ncbi:Lrp/AsnC family transcriptional regulator [Olivibacter sp. SDN3]|uniref:Lrp/AsnC family transcriptional regulator n=1 Tax=Olivibacter sp. SDN3 TaxID=2764720 RepID=UPI001651A549|nr:Lrp/AsnC family transcriptional regulator [Olivibacter sp. SDN3]QNL50500.1 Lrp/AsnC family transcriptional regulator [Olivibacter sp. SDN3]
MELTEISLDKIDLQILSLLQDNCKITNADLARELGMAPSGILERVRKLEQKGILTQYTARVNPAAVNQNLLAFIFIKVADGLGCGETDKSLAAIEAIQEVHHITGEDCYLVKIRVSSSNELMELMRSSFRDIPNIISTRTTIVLETVKENQHIVIPKSTATNE